MRVELTRGEHYIKRLECGDALFLVRSMPNPNLEAIRVFLDLVLPLHDSDRRTVVDSQQGRVDERLKGTHAMTRFGPPLDESNNATV